MSERDKSGSHRRWLITGAITIGISVSWMLLWALSQYQANYVHQQETRASQRAEGASSVCYTIFGLAPLCITNDKAAKAETQRADDDLKAQEDMAEWAKWISLFTALQVGLSAVGLFLIVGTFRQTSESVRLARQTYIAEHRTWLKVWPTTDIGPVWHENGTYRFRGVFTVKNVGKEPATQVRLFAYPYVGKGFAPGADLMAKIVNLESAIAAKFQAGVTAILLQGEATSTTFTANFAEDATIKAKTDEQIAAGVPPENLPLAFSVVYGVTYRSAVDADRICHSAYMLSLVRRDGGEFSAYPVSTVSYIRATVHPGTSSMT